MPRKGRNRKKTRTHVVENEAAASALTGKSEEKIPRSLVVSRCLFTIRLLILLSHVLYVSRL